MTVYFALETEKVFKKSFLKYLKKWIPKEKEFPFLFRIALRENENGKIVVIIRSDKYD